MRLAGSRLAARRDTPVGCERGDADVARRPSRQHRPEVPADLVSADNSTVRGWGGDPCTNITRDVLAALGRVHLQVRRG